ncbi:MAG TPA: DUF4037 domain-containing protein [Anaerolineae bacterium]
MPDFIPGLDLNERFYREVVRPILRQNFPGLAYSAARLGSGSDVLGYDDEMSTDHDWGIRQQIFLPPADHTQYAAAVLEALSHQLPYRYHGYSVHFSAPDEEGTAVLEAIDSGPVNHRIEVVTARGFFTGQLGIDPAREWDAIDWLSVAQQQLLGVTTGRVFTDDLGELEALRQKLAYYPHDVWLYLLACQWRRIGQEDHFVGRTGYRGDDIGSRLLAARLVHDIMQLCFLMEKRYAPYPKWFGLAFRKLTSAAVLGPILRQALAAGTWQERETHLCTAFEVVGEMHNRLQITPPMPAGCVQFHDRPFRVHSGDYEKAIREAIGDEQVKQLHPHLGSIDQFSHSTDLRSHPDLFGKLRPLYQ